MAQLRCLLAPSTCRGLLLQAITPVGQCCRSSTGFALSTAVADLQSWSACRGVCTPVLVHQTQWHSLGQLVQCQQQTQQLQLVDSVLLQHARAYSVRQQQGPRPAVHVQQDQAALWQLKQVRHHSRDAKRDVGREAPHVEGYSPHTKGQQQQPQPRLRAAPDAAYLTASLMNAETPSELIKLFVGNVQSINHIHVIAALTRAAKLWDSTGLATVGDRTNKQQQQQESTVDRQQLQQLLKHLAGPFARGMPYYKGREISSGLWSYARCGQAVPQELLTAAAQQVGSWDTLSDPNTTTQHIVNLSWALTTLGCKDRQLYGAIAAAAQQKLDQLTASQVSVLAWTLARAGFRDDGLIKSLADRAKALLADQLQNLQQRQQVAYKSKKLSHSQWKQKTLADRYRFNTRGLAGLAWAFGTAWKWSDVALLSTVAAVSLCRPLLDNFKPHDAANLLQGLAVAAGAVEPEPDENSRNITSSTSTDNGGAADSSGRDVRTARAGAAATAADAPVATAAIPVSNPVTEAYWPAAVAIAGAALRHQAEASAGSYVRIMWSLAALDGYRQVIAADSSPGTETATPHTAAAAVGAAPNGSLVFDQLCTAVQGCWIRQAIEPQAVVLATWALMQAQQTGLIPPQLQPADSSLEGSISSDRSLPPSQRLLLLLVDVIAQMADRDSFKPQQVADLCAAFVKLQLLSRMKLLPDTAQQQQQLDQVEPSQISSANSSGGVQHAVEQARSPDSSMPTPEQQLSTTVQQQLAHWDAAAAASMPGVMQVSAAVSALAGAAGRVVHELRLGDTVKLLRSLGKLQVQNDELYQQLLQHLTPQQLLSVDAETLTTATQAISYLAWSQPQVLLPVQCTANSSQANNDNDDGVGDSAKGRLDVVEQLLGACLERWGSPASAGGFDDLQRSKLRSALKQVMPPLRDSPRAVQLMEICGAY